MVCGLGRINGDKFGPERSRALVMSYDYMVLAGTQGIKNHAKKDRMFEIAEQQRLPTVLFAEGGGGRPGDTDGATFPGPSTPTAPTKARDSCSCATPSTCRS